MHHSPKILQEDSQTQYWNSIAYSKVFTTPCDLQILKKYILLEHIILDYGCGYGRILSKLLDCGYKNLYGIDSSSEMINRGKNEHPDIKFIMNDCVSILFPDNFFDAVLLFGVLTCIPSDDKQLNVIAEIKRVLKPGGIIFINDFLINHDERNIVRYNDFKNKSPDYQYGVFLESGCVLRHHSKDWIKKILSPFKEEEYKESIFRTLHNHKGNGFCYVGRKQ